MKRDSQEIDEGGGYIWPFHSGRRANSAVPRCCSGAVVFASVVRARWIISLYRHKCLDMYV